MGDTGPNTETTTEPNTGSNVGQSGESSGEVQFEVGSEEWIIDLARSIYNTLGRGYLECVYHRAFEYELRLNGIRYESEKLVPILYKGMQVGYGRADIVLPDYNIIIEFKSVASPPRLPEMEQIGHYMRHLGICKGIIINFGQPSLNQRESVDYIIIRNEN
jgi:GxxExxY protein